MQVDHASNQMSLCKRKRRNSGTMTTTELSSPVLKRTDDAVPKLRMDNYAPTEKNKLDETPCVPIYLEGPGCCCTVVRHISPGDGTDEIRFLKEVRDRFRLPCEAAEVKVEFISETTQGVEWTIPSKQRDGADRPGYRKGLFKKKDGRGIYDGVYAVVSYLDMYPIIWKNLQSTYSREGEHKGHGKGGWLWARSRRDT
jgi:hypothetical protein